jgi:hypothetical protein
MLLDMARFLPSTPVRLCSQRKSTFHQARNDFESSLNYNVQDVSVGPEGEESESVTS